ncbi:unnamed protein product, partial [Symbiodinium sp. CCMP2456]
PHGMAIALGLLGQPGAGKTSLARSVAMALSRYHIRRVGKTGEVVFRPDIFDDGSLCEQPFKKVKAFTDVGNIESMSKERWGAAKWVRGQPRLYCVNDFEPETEPANDLPILAQRQGVISYVSHKEFMDMLDKAWYEKEKTSANVLAVLKRTHILLNTKSSLYVRPASEKESPVLRMPFGDKSDLLHLESRPVYDYHRKGGTDMPKDFQKKVEWETSWVEKVMAGDFDNLPYRATIISKSSFVEPSRPSKRESATDIQEILRNNLGSSSILDCHAGTHSHEAAGSDLKRVKEELEYYYAQEENANKEDCTLTKLAFIKSRQMWAHRCRVKACQRFVQPADFHPIFVSGAGSSKTSLQKQASVLLCAVASVPQHCVSKILDVDDKIVSRVYTNVDMARARFVMAHEKYIQYGGGPDWVDVEADEVDLGKAVVDNNKVKWEQWCGIVQRGSPKTLRLVQLQPPLTKTRSPGPGPIRKKDWKPIAEKLLAGRHIVLHTDGARAYKLKLDKVAHCNVVHKKKKIKIGNKVMWVKPHFTKVYQLSIPGGKTLRVKSGTQIIDRCWRHLREHIKNSPRSPGNTVLMRKIRSAQWVYWQKGKSLWTATGEMLKYLCR